MKSWLYSALFGLVLSVPAFALDSGAPAPDFKGQTSTGKEVKLSDYKGKVVVLEWLNYGCPFVKKHYNGKNMQAVQADAVKRGVVWLSVISSAPGKQGAGTAESAEKDRKEHGSNATEVVLDSSGAIGKMYNAKTTPHMYVIDEKGTLVYQGAIDDKPSTETESLRGAKNYVREALDAVMAKKAVAKATTTAYGCSVKYN